MRIAKYDINSNRRWHFYVCYSVSGFCFNT